MNRILTNLSRITLWKYFSFFHQYDEISMEFLFLFFLHDVIWNIRVLFCTSLIVNRRVFFKFKGEEWKEFERNLFLLVSIEAKKFPGRSRSHRHRALTAGESSHTNQTAPLERFLFRRFSSHPLVILSGVIYPWCVPLCLCVYTLLKAP